MTCGRMINIVNTGYDPRGSGTDYYKGNCEDCGEEFRWSGSIPKTEEKLQAIMTRYCGRPSKVRERRLVSLKEEVKALKKKIKQNKKEIKELEDIGST